MMKMAALQPSLFLVLAAVSLVSFIVSWHDDNELNDMLYSLIQKTLNEIKPRSPDYREIRVLNFMLYICKLGF